MPGKPSVSHPACPRCSRTETVRNGIIKGKQRYKCLSCKRSFRPTLLDNTYPTSFAHLAQFLASEHVPRTRIAQLLDVSDKTVLTWTRPTGPTTGVRSREYLLDQFEENKLPRRIVSGMRVLFRFQEFTVVIERNTHLTQRISTSSGDHLSMVNE